MIRLAIIGTASTGKSALINALFGTDFVVDACAGATDFEESAVVAFEGREIEVADTPPLESVTTRMRADAYLLVCDKDLIDIEHEQIVSITRPVGVAVNKADTYSRPQMRQLLQHIRRRLAGVVTADRIVACAAHPVRIVLRESPEGQAVEEVATAPEIGDVARVVRELIAEAEASLRVRTRTLALQTRDAAVNWLRERGTRQ